MTHEELLADARFLLLVQALANDRLTPPERISVRESMLALALEQLTEALRDKLDRMRRYEAALQRIAESDEQAHPLVRVALEALNPTT